MKKKGFGVLAVLMLSMLLSVTAFAKGKWKVEEGNRYYYNEDGTKQKGWLTLKKGTYYFLPKTGIMATGVRQIAGKTYVFSKKGILLKAYERAGFRTTASGKLCYSYGDGTGRLKRQWFTINGKTYYFNKKGHALTGWQKIDGKIYYFNKRYVLQKEKWVKYNGKKMYLGSDGTFVKDTWIDDKYLGPDGVYIKGYRDDRRTNKSKTGWVGYGQQWRYYRKNKLVTGWITIGEKRYFFGSDGYMRAGWLKDQGHTYYMDTRSATYGQMMTGWCKIKNKYYYFFRITEPSIRRVVWRERFPSVSLWQTERRKSISLAKTVPARIIKNPESLSVISG